MKTKQEKQYIKQHIIPQVLLKKFKSNKAYRNGKKVDAEIKDEEFVWKGS